MLGKWWETLSLNIDCSSNIAMEHPLSIDLFIMVPFKRRLIVINNHNYFFGYIRAIRVFHTFRKKIAWRAWDAWDGWDVFFLFRSQKDETMLKPPRENERLEIRYRTCLWMSKCFKFLLVIQHCKKNPHLYSVPMKPRFIVHVPFQNVMGRSTNDWVLRQSDTWYSHSIFLQYNPFNITFSLHYTSDIVGMRNQKNVYPTIITLQ